MTTFELPTLLTCGVNIAKLRDPLRKVFKHVLFVGALSLTEASSYRKLFVEKVKIKFNSPLFRIKDLTRRFEIILFGTK